MESYIKLVLFLIAASAQVFVIFVLLHDWIKRRQEMKFFPEKLSMEAEFRLEQAAAESVKTTVTTIHPKQPTAPQVDEILSLAVMAKEESRFESYDLLAAIAATGLTYGKMNIFHYFPSDAVQSDAPWFSLASADKPGDFDMDEIGNFSCSGLLLFMQISNVAEPYVVYQCMLDVARQLAEYLGGELRASPTMPWNTAAAERCEAKLMAYCM